MKLLQRRLHKPRAEEEKRVGLSSRPKRPSILGFFEGLSKPPKTQAEVALDEDKPNIEYFKEENEVVVTDREEPNEGETKDVENSNNSTR